MAGHEISETQKAWLYKEYGGIDVLEIGEVYVPKINGDMILMKVHAAGLNPVDFKRREGDFKDTDTPPPTVPGYDGAGVVVKVGKDVTRFQVGDEVYTNVSEFALDHPKACGTLTSYTAVEERLVAHKPANITFEEAAGYPLALETAYQGFEIVRLRQGEKVLITNGSGGVGHFAVQLAKRYYKASMVAATTSKPKFDLVRQLGADKVIDYKGEDYTDMGERYNVVLDTAGEVEKALKVGDRVLTIDVLIPVPPPANRFVVVSDGKQLEMLSKCIEDKVINVKLDPEGPFPFEQAKDAFRRLESKHAIGKVVVTMGG